MCSWVCVREGGGEELEKIDWSVWGRVCLWGGVGGGEERRKSGLFFFKKKEKMGVPDVL